MPKVEKQKKGIIDGLNKVTKPPFGISLNK